MSLKFNYITGALLKIAGYACTRNARNVLPATAGKRQERAMMHAGIDN